MTINLLINSITIGIGLAMDAFSVSLANGLYYPKMNFSKRIEIALTFAVFQFIMPLTGWLCVHTILDLFKSLQKFIPWIAFILLSFIGFKMILEGLNNTESVKEESLNFKTLFIQGVATSIDALLVGFTIANVAFLNEENVIIITKKGMAIHFITRNINPIGRVTAGVRSIKLSDDDEVLIGLPVYKLTDYIAFVTSNGYVKKCKIDDFPTQMRAGKGIIAYRPTLTTGEIVGAVMINDIDNFLMIGQPNSICIGCKEIPLLSRISSGSIAIKNSKVMSVVKL